MYKITPRQKKFLDLYIILGNATEAFKQSGYSWTSRQVAEANARRVLGKDSSKWYLKERFEKLESKTIATQQEVLETLTRIMRGESKAHDKLGVGGGEEIMVDDMGPTHNEIIRAADLLGKRYATWTEKHDVNGSMKVQISDDI